MDVGRVEQNRNFRNFTVNEENYNQFQNDSESRNRLLEIRDNLNIRDLSQKYNNGKRPKKAKRFSFTPKENEG